MSDLAELDWHRSWRKRVLSAFRLWRKPNSYEDACHRWGDLAAMLNETVPADANTTERSARSE